MGDHLSCRENSEVFQTYFGGEEAFYPDPFRGNFPLPLMPPSIFSFSPVLLPNAFLATEAHTKVIPPFIRKYVRSYGASADSKPRLATPRTGEAVFSCTTLAIREQLCVYDCVYLK